MIAWLVLPAHARAAETRALLLTEQIRPTQIRGPIGGDVQPEHMVAQRGEEEGFQLAVRPERDSSLLAGVDPSSDPLLRDWTQILRSEWVTITRPSSGTQARPGLYADPLPPQAPGAGAAGRLQAPAGQWSSFVVVVSIPAAAEAGTHRGVIVVRDESGAAVASMPFSVTVVATRSSSGVLEPAISPRDSRNFKVLFNYNPNWYRALAPAADAQSQYEQGYRTLWMLARHRAGTNVWQRAYPTADGRYECSAASGYLKTFSQMPWWADGQAGAIPMKLMPNHAVARCDQQAFTIRDEGSPATKFDDRVGDYLRSAWFIYRVAEHWRGSGVQDQQTYFLNPFDEPSAQQARTSMSAVNKLVHDYAPGVKVLGTTWPQEARARQVCRTIARRKRCAMQRAQGTSNEHLRDGTGGDDLDGWVVPYFRLFGFGVSPMQRSVGIDRSREVIRRLQQIQGRGGEAWAYDLPLGTRRVPQLAIDGPATDARYLFWPMAREGINGWFIAVSNRWVDPVNTSRARNPWDSPLSWVGTRSNDRDNTGPHGVVSNGWGSLYYPPLRPQLGLTDPLAMPVTSLRMQRIRDGVEDANLMRQYRDRFGQAALSRSVASVVGPLASAADLPGRETFPRTPQAGLALRMELVRRQLLADLAS